MQQQALCYLVPGIFGSRRSLKPHQLRHLAKGCPYHCLSPVPGLPNVCDVGLRSTFWRPGLTRTCGNDYGRQSTAYRRHRRGCVNSRVDPKGPDYKLRGSRLLSSGCCASRGTITALTRKRL